jgi:hypothetical protein
MSDDVNITVPEEIMADAVNQYFTNIAALGQPLIRSMANSDTALSNLSILPNQKWSVPSWYQ